MNKLTIDELEILTPDELGWLLLAEVKNDSRDVQFIQDLLDVGCPIDFPDSSGWTALHLAARYGNHEVVKLLISNGVDIHVRNINGWNLLHIVSGCGILLLTETFVTNIGITARYKLGSHEVDQHAYIEVLKLLLSNGAQVDAKDGDNRTLLHWAARIGNVLVAEFLISNGADVNARDIRGYTPLGCAYKYNNTKMSKVLISSGAIE